MIRLSVFATAHAGLHLCCSQTTKIGFLPPSLNHNILNFSTTGNLPSALVEDARSMVSEDCGSMYPNDTGNDYRVPARETVVAKLPNDLDAEDDGAGEEDFEFVESSQSNKKGKVVKHVSTVKS